MRFCLQEGYRKLTKGLQDEVFNDGGIFWRIRNQK